MNHTPHTRFYPALLALLLMLISGIFSVSAAPSGSCLGKQKCVQLHRQSDIHSFALCFICEEIETETKSNPVEYKVAHPACIACIRIFDFKAGAAQYTTEQVDHTYTIPSHLPLYLGIRSLLI